jgi:hypothetical protein
MESTQSFLGGLLSHGVQMGMDPEDKPNPIVEASLRYSASVGVALLNQIDDVSDQVYLNREMIGSHAVQLENNDNQLEVLEDVICAKVRGFA